MPFTPMRIHGAYVFEPVKFTDKRGEFQESFKLSALADELGVSFTVKQVNQSISAKGVIRGIHFAENPPGQAKYVSCPKGTVWDVVVDLRLNSPTFGQWEGAELSGSNGKSVLISDGLGHCFLSLEDDSVVNYLCSEEYRPRHEHRVHPLDDSLSIDFGRIGRLFGVADLLLSEEDKFAPSLQSVKDAGILPRH